MFLNTKVPMGNSSHRYLCLVTPNVPPDDKCKYSAIYDRITEHNSSLRSYNSKFQMFVLERFLCFKSFSFFFFWGGYFWDCNFFFFGFRKFPQKSCAIVIRVIYLCWSLPVISADIRYPYQPSADIRYLISDISLLFNDINV